MPAQPADLDLYLERQAADGSWERGRSPATTAARSTARRSPSGGWSPGKYRLEVHNCAGRSRQRGRG